MTSTVKEDGKLGCNRELAVRGEDIVNFNEGDELIIDLGFNTKLGTELSWIVLSPLVKKLDLGSLRDGNWWLKYMCLMNLLFCSI